MHDHGARKRYKKVSGGYDKSMKEQETTINTEKEEIGNFFVNDEDVSGEETQKESEGSDISTEEKKKKRGSEAMAWVRDILLAVLIALVISQFIQPTIVREHSMQNTLQPDDYLILSKMAYKFGGDIKYGDIIVFESDMETAEGKKKLLIKRVIAMGGDTVAVRDGLVYVNGEILDEPYIKDGYTNGGIDETVVPEGELFLLGDNRVVSVDSRSPEVGFVSEDLVIGKAVVRLLPLGEMGSIYKNLPENSAAGKEA